MATITDTQMLPTEIQPAALSPAKVQTPAEVQSTPLQTLSLSGHTVNDLPGPGAHVVTRQETWKYPRINTWRLAAVFFAFINFGMNDACYGALLPYVCLEPKFLYSTAS